MSTEIDKVVEAIEDIANEVATVKSMAEESRKPRVELVREEEATFAQTLCRNIGALAVAHSKGMDASAESLSKVYGEWGISSKKGLDGLQFSGGSNMIQHEIHDEMFDVLRAKSAFLSAGPEISDYNNVESVRIQRWDQAVNGSWNNVHVQKPELESLESAEVKLVGHTLSVDVIIDKKMQRQTPRNIERDVMRQIERGFGTSMDVAMFTGLGQEYRPQGLDFWAQTDINADAAWVPGPVAAADKDDDLRKLYKALLQKNIIDNGSRLAWFASDLTFADLEAERDGLSGPYFRHMLDGNLIRKGYKYHGTQNIDNETIYLVDMSKIMVGKFSPLDMRVLPETQNTPAHRIVVRADIEVGMAPVYGGLEIARLNIG